MYIHWSLTETSNTISLISRNQYEEARNGIDRSNVAPLLSLTGSDRSRLGLYEKWKCLSSVGRTLVISMREIFLPCATRAYKAELSVHARRDTSQSSYSQCTVCCLRRTKDYIVPLHACPRHSSPAISPVARPRRRLRMPRSFDAPRMDYS
jgi:hypothetical protein